jgi:hypothetical protein
VSNGIRGWGEWEVLKFGNCLGFGVWNLGFEIKRPIVLGKAGEGDL